MFNHKTSAKCNKLITSLLYWQLITKISQKCFTGRIGEMIAGDAIPPRDIPIGGKIASHRASATPYNRDER